MKSSKLMKQDIYVNQRREMVEKQIEARGVRDQAVLNAMRKVPRHLFVPADMLESAYDDTPLSIGHGQTISQPYIVALMTELLQLTSTQKVLEIGTGSGYQTAILAELVGTVYTIEIVEPLVEPTQKLLQSLGYTNVVSMYGDGYQGWPEYAPFDGIIVTAAPSLVPKPLIQQLTMGGRMVIPVGDYHQDLILLTKTKSGLQRRNVTAVRFVPMTGEVEKQNANDDGK
ncbi:MAG: protein-L-isoaspartate(D-aspartate) O-methyltransferase [Deltaproteobacteria bacterium]|nr:protein-L-isoaspartate(D-aspartate) O-methyltransferase [Deltaproteobacteria bacterium]